MPTAIWNKKCTLLAFDDHGLTDNYGLDNTVYCTDKLKTFKYLSLLHIPCINQFYNIPCINQIHNIPCINQIHNIPCINQIHNIYITNKIHYNMYFIHYTIDMFRSLLRPPSG